MLFFLNCLQMLLIIIPHKERGVCDQDMLRKQEWQPLEWLSQSSRGIQKAAPRWSVMDKNSKQ